MRNVFPYTIIVVLLVVILFMSQNKKQEIVEIRTSDTITVSRVDTFFCDKTHFVREVIKDTIYIEKGSENGLKLPLTQRYYSTGEYQAWVSGYKPNLDSIRTFNKTEYKYVTNTVEKIEYKKSTDVFLNIGSYYIDGYFSPNIGASVKFKNDFVIGGAIGYSNESVYYGINFGYKLNN